MKCRICNGVMSESDDIVRGQCNSCYDKSRTCTECRRLVDAVAVYIVPGVGRGHKECLDTATAYQRLNNGKIDVRDGRVCI